MTNFGRRATDSHGILDRIKVAFSRYGAIGALVVASPLWLPYVEDYFISKWMIELRSTIKTEIYNAHANENFLNDAVLIKVVRTSVAKQSIHKVDYIKDLIENRDLKDLKTRERIKQDIRNELTRQSSIYINFLNNFNHPKLGLIGTHIAKTFPMEEFLAKVNVLVLDNGTDIHIIGEDVMRYMLTIQEKFFNDMYAEMKH